MSRVWIDPQAGLQPHREHRVDADGYGAVDTLGREANDLRGLSDAAYRLLPRNQGVTGRNYKRKSKMVTDIFGRLKSLRDEEKQLVEESLSSERSEVLAIAVKEYLGTTDDSDADTLYNAMAILQMDDAEFRSRVAAIGRVCRTVANAEVAQAKAKTHAADFENAQRQMHIAKHRTNHWQRRVHELMKAGGDHTTAQSDAAKTKADYPALFVGGKIAEPLAEVVKKIKSEILKNEADREKNTRAMAADALNSTLRRFDLPELKKGESLV
ncbi:hypothetical protein CA13_66920 [Planctomycetes bacterium CA13]|uniref:Uncharacterized protein n=1 Tax=Novipirellula herctigrandis TaxID=2527986 RepID=A0A5C5YMN4_9BACT|nr:hypothetical protein CA13_66920 [Planctomycetes bacterium CA13]